MPEDENRSGGVDLHADTINIYGDVVGRDKSGGDLTPPSITPPAQPPLELSIRIEKTSDAEDAPLRASVHVERLGLSAGPFDFAIPLDDKALADIHWYLERYPQWPVGPDYDRALGVEAKLRTWGKALFDTALATREALRVYDGFRRAEATGHLVTIDATDARVLRLPWELLADEDGYLFTQKPPVGVRRRLQKAKAKKTPTFALPLRILMLISRPDDAGFLDPRSSAEALLDAVEPLGERVVVEFLYPPTLAALTRRLRDPKRPPVHVVHFDGHGVYVSQTGLGYLLFENDDHKENRVNADDLGALLNDTGVPLMLLDACQTAMADQTNPFGSVASRLIEAGIGSVLAMNYSVLVSATRLLTSAFYTALTQGSTIGQAVDAARFEMLMNTERYTLYREGKEEAIHLRDWFLPALYQQAGDPVVLNRSLTPGPSPTGRGVGERVRSYPARGGFPDEPRHGFHGREKELLHLRRTLAERAIVVLHGYGGQGKTALATHAARWFTRTRLFERAIFVSFERGGGLEYALAEMGAALIGDNFAIHQGDPIDAIGNALREQATLVVWDNFESVLRGGDAPLADDAMQKLLDTAARWFSPPLNFGGGAGGGGLSRLIITTRDPSLPHPTFEPGRTAAHSELPGLGRLDALDLAAQILKDRGIPRPRREKLADLLDFLGGHPLSINLVAPHLRDHTPEQLIAEFDALLPGFTTGKGKERNESLRVSLDFSLRRLGDETRNLLPALAVFQGRAMEDDLLEITGFPPEAWAAARAELTRAGLATIEQLPNVQFPYIHFHPTLLPHLAAQLTPERRAELEERYRQAYHALARYEYHEDNKNPQFARAIVIRELPNLRRALDLTIAASSSSSSLSGGTEGGEALLEAAATLANSIAYFLNAFGRWTERDAILAQVERLVGARSEAPGGVSRAEFMTLSQRGEALWQAGRAAEAERVFRDLLARIGDQPSLEKAQTLQALGRSLFTQGRDRPAIEIAQQAIATMTKLPQNTRMKSKIASVHSDLGNMLREIGEYAEAQKECEVALEVARDIDDKRNVGVILGQLGTIALVQGNLAKAQRRLMEALNAFRAIAEPQGEAIGWHQLGMVAQEAKDWAKAEKFYREALQIRERIGDKAELAKTCHQLAIVAKKCGRPDEAERWYKRAIELKEQVSNPKEVASSLNNLADLYLSQGRLDEAERFAHRAREIMETLDLSAQPWTTYNILAQIADKRGQAEEARQWRRKEQETYQAFVDRSGGQVIDPNVRKWEPRIQAIVAACNGDAQALQQLEPVFQRLETADDWRNLIPVIRRIIAGERGIELTEGLHRTHAAIVRRILGLLAGEDRPSPLPSPLQGEGAAPSPRRGEGRGEGPGEGQS
ncbi:MAG TPA: tetratricopeptide repeat protein [Anaerolineae bacterium]|nr:tetratricopeptide repeat protein [Anaerolineae bacterium]